MCMVIFIASSSPLPLVPWQDASPAFNVKELSEHEERVRSHLSLPNVRCAGSHTCCGCGFNEGRRYPEYVDDPNERVGALESASRLARYVREHRVEQIYSCWCGDENEPQVLARHVTPNGLVAKDFFFRERELLSLDHDVV